MNMREKRKPESRFPLSLFGLYLGVLLLMSGIHTGLVTLVNENQWHSLIQIAVPSVYWTLVAAGLTYFTRSKIIKTYDQPMKELARAAEKVAQGDFSVYVPPIHTSNHHDYLDLMFLDFNKMVAELGSIETMRTDFIANVSHDFRSPLTSIKGYLEAILDGTIPSELYEKYLSRVISETERLHKLTESMLTLNSLDARGYLSRTNFDINRVIKNTAASFEGTCGKKNISFQLIFSDNIQMVYADMGKIQQVLYNLIDNAIKFSHNGSTIYIQASHRHEKIFISVKDSGIGIPEDALDHIFDRFFRVDKARSREVGGTGLGLAITKNVVQMHRGVIDVESVPGEGTTFAMRIPLTYIVRQEARP